MSIIYLEFCDSSFLYGDVYAAPTPAASPPSSRLAGSDGGDGGGDGGGGGGDGDGWMGILHPTGSAKSVMRGLRGERGFGLVNGLAEVRWQ